MFLLLLNPSCLSNCISGGENEQIPKGMLSMLKSQLAGISIHDDAAFSFIPVLVVVAKGSVMVAVFAADFWREIME